MGGRPQNQLNLMAVRSICLLTSTSITSLPRNPSSRLIFASMVQLNGTSHPLVDHLAPLLIKFPSLAQKRPHHRSAGKTLALRSA